MSNTEKNIIDNFLNDDESLWSNSKNFPYIPSNASVIKHYEKHLSNDKHSKAWKDKERVIVHNNNNYVYSGNSAIGKQVIGENIIDPYNLYEADVFAAVNSKFVPVDDILINLPAFALVIPGIPLPTEKCALPEIDSSKVKSA